jgi:hypothetical protein
MYHTPSYTYTWNVNCRMWFEMCSPHKAVQRDVPVDLGVLPQLLRVGQVLEAIGYDVRMGPTPVWGTELHHGDEPSQVVDVSFGVVAMDQSGKIEQLCTLWERKGNARVHDISCPRGTTYV